MTSDTQPTKRHTIVIVDDEPDILDALKRLFRRRYRVLTTTRPDAALALLDEHDVHLVMTDQRMPHTTGVAFLARVRAQHPNVVRILFTGYSDLQSVVQAINDGNIYGYVPKPWDPDELKALVARALAHHDLLADRHRLTEQLQHTNRELERRNAELAQAMQSLQDLDRMKSIFMELVSHELNTPIAIVLGYAFLLRQDVERNNVSTKSLNNGLEAINNSALRLKNIATKIFTVFASETPMLRPQHTLVSVRELAERVQTHVQPFLTKRLQTLELDITPPDLTAELDPPKIHDALYHLIVNAIKFSPDGHTIRFVARAELEPEPPTPAQPDAPRAAAPSATPAPESGDSFDSFGAIQARSDADRPPPGWLVLEVQDQGVGIEPRDQPRIFQSFFGTFNSWHHSSGDFGFEKRGIGLGLTIVQKFAELHGGTVSVHSERGEGSVFTMRLPLRAASDDALSADPSAPR